MVESATYNFIDDYPRLKKVCSIISSLRKNEFIGLDTEFMRMNYFYPDFSLLQLAIRHKNYLIDVLNLGHINKYILDALCNTDATILTFSCSEDISLLANTARSLRCNKILPKRIYDIQQLLSFAGYSYGRGLNHAVHEFLDITLSKDCTLSNWNRRPLSIKQKVYSALDVAYLEDLFNSVDLITSESNFQYFKSEMEYIRSSALKVPSDDEAYLSVPGAGLLNINELNVLYHIAKNRQIKAMVDNKALNLVITTNAMWHLAKYLPRNKRELAGRGVKPMCLKRYGNDILAWLNHARKEPLNKNLVIPYDYFSHHRCMQANFNRLKAAMKEQIKKSGICHELLTKKPLLNDYFRAKALGQTPLIQQSWRLKVLGKIDVPLEPLSKIPDEDLDENMPSSRFVTDYMKLNEIDKKLVIKTPNQS